MTGEMVFTTKSDPLSWIHMVEGENCLCGLSSDLHLYTVVPTHTNTNMYALTHTREREVWGGKKREREKHIEINKMYFFKEETIENKF